MPAIYKYPPWWLMTSTISYYNYITYTYLQNPCVFNSIGWSQQQGKSPPEGVFGRYSILDNERSICVCHSIIAPERHTTSKDGGRWVGGFLPIKGMHKTMGAFIGDERYLFIYGQPESPFFTESFPIHQGKTWEAIQSFANTFMDQKQFYESRGEIMAKSCIICIPPTGHFSSNSIDEQGIISSPFMVMTWNYKIIICLSGTSWSGDKSASYKSSSAESLLLCHWGAV